MAVVTCPECSEKFNAYNENATKCPTCGHEFSFNAEVLGDRNFMSMLAGAGAPKVTLQEAVIPRTQATGDESELDQCLRTDSHKWWLVYL